MTLQEFKDKMIDQYDAYWCSYYIPDWKDKSMDENTPGWRYDKPDPRMDQDIVQIDSLGLSTGNESLMINMDFYIEELNVKIQATCKMLGHSLDKCLEIIKEITEFVPTCYMSVS